MPVPRRRALRAALHVVLGAAGVAALVALIRGVGSDALLALLAGAAPVLPLLALLEAARLACDALGTWTQRAPGEHGGLRVAVLARVYAVTYPLTALFPAGRTAAEAARAAMLSRHLGGARAAAIATTNQALGLAAAGALSLPAAAVAFAWTGASALTTALLAHCALTVGVGLAIQVAARRRAVAAFLARRSGRLGRAAAAFCDAARERPPVPLRTFAAALGNRVLQLGQFALLLAAVGAPAGPGRALLANGVNALGATVGDLIPAQMGATDSVFAAAAPALGVTAGAAVTMSVLVHAVQIGGALACMLAGVVWQGGQGAGQAAAV